MVKSVGPEKYFDEENVTPSPLKKGKVQLPAEKVALARIRGQFHEKGDLKRVLKEIKKIEKTESKVDLAKLLKECISEKQGESKKIPIRLWFSSHFGQIHKAEELHQKIEKEAKKEQEIYDILAENHIIKGEHYSTEVKDGHLNLIFKRTGRAYHDADKALNLRFSQYRHYCEENAATIEIYNLFD